MKRVTWAVGAVLLLFLVGGCGVVGFLRSTPTPSPVVVPATDRPTSPPPVLTPTRAASGASVAEPTSTIDASLPSTTSNPTLPADLLAMMAAIEAEAEELRGLDRTLPITRTLMTRQELTARLEREFADDYPPEEVEADVRVLAAFDFVPDGFDLKGLLLALYSSQILGMYDDEDDTFYIVTELAESDEATMDLLDQLTVAHEYTHGLQDQHFELETFTDDESFNDDEVLARMALVEGDASLVMMEYLLAHMSELTAEDLQGLQGERVQADQDVLDRAPPIIRETLDFPYVYGLEFVTAVRERGWEAVNDAFADPPRSTEQILHPEKYFSGDEPVLVTVPPLTDTLGIGWHLVDAETLGEFQTNLYLAQQVDQATAKQASEGWDGDQYALYAKEEAEVMVFVTIWDSPADGDEFAAAYTQYADNKYGQPASRAGSGEFWWETPAQTTCLAWEGGRVVVILGPDPETVAKVLTVARRQATTMAGRTFHWHRD
jgi:hypothetical protein